MRQAGSPRRQPTRLPCPMAVLPFRLLATLAGPSTPSAPRGGRRTIGWRRTFRGGNLEYPGSAAVPVGGAPVNAPWLVARTGAGELRVPWVQRGEPGTSTRCGTRGGVGKPMWHSVSPAGSRVALAGLPCRPAEAPGRCCALLGGGAGRPSGWVRAIERSHLLNCTGVLARSTRTSLPYAIPKAGTLHRGIHPSSTPMLGHSPAGL